MMRAWRRGLVPVAGVVLGFCLCAGVVRAAVVEPKTREGGEVIVTVESADVREGPSHKYEALTVVEKGEVFPKLGRTKGWYYIRLGDDSFGWISGKEVRRYRGEQSPPPYAGTYNRRFNPYYPGSYYYDYYYWGPPYLSWEWYFYDHDRHRDRSWDHDRYDHRDRDWDHDRDRDRDRDRPREERGRADQDRPQRDIRSRDAERYRVNEPGRSGETGRRYNPGSRSSTPRNRGSFEHR